MVGRKVPINFDTYGHLYFAKEVKEQKTGPCDKIQLRVIGNDGLSNPFLWQWIIALLPIDQVLKYQKWINPILDSLFTVFIYFISTKIGFSQKDAIFISALYIFTPMWFSNLSMGPRVTSLTPRLFSEIGTNIFFIVTIIPLELHYLIVLSIGIVFSFLVILSSKFSLQAIILLTPIISILSHNIYPTISLLISLVLCVVLFRRRFIDILLHHLKHLIWYYKENLNGAMPVSNRNSFHKLFGSLDKHNGFARKVMAVIGRMLSGNSYTGVLFKMQILPIVLSIYFNIKVNIDILIPDHFIIPVVGAVIIFLIVNIPRFLFLGEAERYLNHIAFFIVASLVFLSNELNMMWIVIYLLGFGFLYWVFESFILANIIPNKNAIQRISDDIVLYLQNINKKTIILSYPYHAIGVWRLMLETAHKVIFANLDDIRKGKSNTNWYADNYPYVKLDVIDKMHDELGVNVLIIDNKRLERRYIGWRPSTLWTKLEIGTPFFTVYEISE